MCLQSGWLDTGDVMAEFLWRILDTSLYFACESLIFSWSIDETSSNMDWHGIWYHLSQRRRNSLCVVSMPGKHDFFQGLHVFALKVACMARQANSESFKRHDVQALTQQIIEWEQRVLHPNHDVDFGDILACLSRAFVGAILLHLIKLTLPHACSKHPRIQNVVQERTVFVQRYIRSSSRSFLLGREIPFRFLGLYPVVILLCAVDTAQTFKELVQEMEFLRGFGNRPGCAVTELVLRIKYRKQNPGAVCVRSSDRACGGVHDGMDFLLHPEGILGKFRTRLQS